MYPKRIVVAVAALLQLAAAVSALAQEPVVQIYLVRHPETDPSPQDPKAIHLSDAGRQRVSLLAPTFAGVRLSHLFASHTVRALETLDAISRDRALSVVQLPRPGSVLHGSVVTDETSRREAIDPVAEALLALPPGSIAIAALNSENIFAVLNRLGVPVAAPGKTCEPGQFCVPCLSNACFPSGAFDRVWYLVRRPGQSAPVVFSEFRYAVGWLPGRTP